MKVVYVLVLITLGAVHPASAQKKKYNPEAPGLFVSITRDSSISKQKLLDGFSLCLTDTEYEVISFTLSYFCRDSIYYIQNTGPKVDTSLVLFKTTIREISVGTLLVIDNIKVLDPWYYRRTLPSILLKISD